MPLALEAYVDLQSGHFKSTRLIWVVYILIYLFKAPVIILCHKENVQLDVLMGCYPQMKTDDVIITI